MKPELLLIGNATPRMINKFEENFVLHSLSDISDLDKWLSDNAHKIEAVATNGHDGVKAEIMERLSALKVISCYGVGYDGIDVVTAAERKILVSHTPDVLNADVANLAILLMLATSRCILRDDKWVRSGNWQKQGNAPLTRSIENKKVGIVGLGRIGATIATKLSAFNCEIMYHSRNPKDVAYAYYGDLTEMAGNADYLVVITPGGPSTNKLVNRQVLDALGKEGTLINVARGSVVDEDELVSALVDGRLGWAGLDVFEDEPNAPERLFEMENVVLTPHSASATEETRQAMGDLTVDNLVQYFTDKKVLTPVPECAHLQ